MEAEHQKQRYPYSGWHAKSEREQGFPIAVVKQALRVLDCSIETGVGETYVASDLRQQCGTAEQRA